MDAMVTAKGLTTMKSQMFPLCTPWKRTCGWSWRRNGPVLAQMQQEERRNIADKAEFRRNVGICLVNAAGLVFAARRVDDTSGAWQMPQGGIDHCENAMDAALRELREETGIRSARIVATVDEWLTYEFPTEVRNQMTGAWARYRGQTQKWMLIYFYGRDEEIQLDSDGEREFLDYQWMPLDLLPQKVVPFKAAVYTQVANEFAPLIRQVQQRGRMNDPWWSRK